LNVTFALQLAPAARLDPHVLLKILKSPGFAPARVTLLMVIAPAPLFVSVATFCPPIPPTDTDAQLKLVGDTEAASAAAGVSRTSADNARRKVPNPFPLLDRVLPVAKRV